MPNPKKQVEVFSAGCGLCDETLALVRRLACDSCEVIVRDMQQPEAAAQARAYGIHSVPAVVVAGKLAACCHHLGPQEPELRAAGLGASL